MADILSSMYGVSDSKINIISNISFYQSNEFVRDKENLPIKIGHLANLSVDKGALYFVEICRYLKKRDFKFHAYIAGPFLDDEVEKEVLIAVEEIESLKYEGSVYGQKKEAFLSSLDVFVFPSKYRNEAEPLVLFEAGRYGVFSIGTRRGCMENVIDTLGGASFNETDDLVTIMANKIEKTFFEGGFSVNEINKRIDLYNNNQELASKSLDSLLSIMEQENVPKT